MKVLADLQAHKEVETLGKYAGCSSLLAPPLVSQHKSLQCWYVLLCGWPTTRSLRRSWLLRLSHASIPNIWMRMGGVVPSLPPLLVSWVRTSFRVGCPGSGSALLVWRRSESTLLRCGVIMMREPDWQDSVGAVRVPQAAHGPRLGEARASSSSSWVRPRTRNRETPFERLTTVSKLTSTSSRVSGRNGRWPSRLSWRQT